MSTPNQSKSVKFPQETQQKVKHFAELIGCAQSKFMIDSIEGVLQMIANPGNETIPKVVAMAQIASTYDANPRSFPKKQESGT